MNPKPCPLTLDDLPELDAQMLAECNADLLHMGRREYDFVGQVLRFERRSVEPSAPLAGDVWLAFQHAGSPLHVRVSRPWADAMAGAAGLSLNELGRDKLELLCLTRLSPLLPSTLQFLAAAFSNADLPQLPEPFLNHGTWCGVYSATGEVSALDFQIVAPSNFPVYAFIASFDRYLMRWLPPRLAGLPLSVPMVAARWTIDAGDLVGLEVGDVLLIS